MKPHPLLVTTIQLLMALVATVGWENHFGVEAEAEGAVGAFLFFLGLFHGLKLALQAGIRTRRRAAWK